VKIYSGVTKTGSITASVSATTTASVEAGFVMAKFSGSLGVTVAAAGTRTNQGTESVELSLARGSYAVFVGTKKFVGQYTGKLCNSTGTAQRPLGGRTVSWAVRGDGAASCAGRYAPSSFEFKARVIAC